jgi:misacylated tRNA(Ala) deacylase
MIEKQYDPKMHTAEHILNQTMGRMFGCGRSFNSHIERKKSKCDYRIGRELTNGEVKEIEAKVNSIIYSKVDVTENFVSKTQAADFLDLSKLPVDAPDKIRVVRIGDYDACACIGPHVKNTSEIGVFAILSSDFNDGVVRLRFKLVESE